MCTGLSKHLTVHVYVMTLDQSINNVVMTFTSKSFSYLPAFPLPCIVCNRDSQIVNSYFGIVRIVSFLAQFEGEVDSPIPLRGLAH